jgi:hypothetical protein
MYLISALFKVVFDWEFKSGAKCDSLKEDDLFLGLEIAKTGVLLILLKGLCLTCEKGAMSGFFDAKIPEIGANQTEFRAKRPQFGA